MVFQPVASLAREDEEGALKIGFFLRAQNGAGDALSRTTILRSSPGRTKVRTALAARLAASNAISTRQFSPSALADISVSFTPVRRGSSEPGRSSQPRLERMWDCSNCSSGQSAASLAHNRSSTRFSRKYSSARWNAVCRHPATIDCPGIVMSPCLPSTKRSQTRGIGNTCWEPRPSAIQKEQYEHGGEQEAQLWHCQVRKE